MRHYVKGIVFVICMLSFFYSCEVQDEDQKNGTVSIDEDTKELIEQDSMCLTIEEARYFASQELQEGAREFLLIEGNFDLSEQPRVVWAYDNRPKYYEFDVIQQGEVVATITTFAQKEEKAVIAFMFNEPRNREKKKGLDMYEGLYPTVFWGKRGEYGAQPRILYKEDATSLVSEIPSVNEYERYEKVARLMDKESNVETQKMLAYNREVSLKKRSQVLNFWKQKTRNFNSLTNTIQIKSKDPVNDNDILTGSPTTASYIIPAYNVNLRKTRWCGDCGPSVVAWVYRGLYSHYPYNSTSQNSYINIYGDPEKKAIVKGKTVLVFGYTVLQTAKYLYEDSYLPNIINHVGDNVSRQIDNGLYEAIFAHAHYVPSSGNSYAMYQAGINNAMKELTNNMYSITTTTQSRDHIKNKHLPVFIMIGTGDSFHYLVAFGVGNSGTKKYIYITDNGTNIGSNGYMPYWRYEGSNYGIRYKVVKR